MAIFEIVVPKLGESVIEATITKWLKQIGEEVNVDDPVVEIATDKVDSEISATVSGKLVKKLYEEGSVVPIGVAFAVVETSADITVEKETGQPPSEVGTETAAAHSCKAEPAIAAISADPMFSLKTDEITDPEHFNPGKTRFYSPLVKSIALRENIPFSELDNIPGSGLDDRLTKDDLFTYIKNKKTPALQPTAEVPGLSQKPLADAPKPVLSGDSRIIEMDRIRQLIANHMVKSVQTSPHVTSFMEADMSNIVKWREKNKDSFQKRENEKLTFTPVFIEAISKAVRDFPMVNVSVDGSSILVHRNINIGMAVALADFNLIVPVVRNTGEKNLLGIIKSVNDLADRARRGKLVPDEISGGTISLTNLGSFGTLMGTPIINQPQTAIVAVGAIKKRVVVLETETGDQMAIRPIMMVSITYDHRVIDGALGGKFLSALVQHLENFDPNQTI